MKNRIRTHTERTQSTMLIVMYGWGIISSFTWIIFWLNNSGAMVMGNLAVYLSIIYFALASIMVFTQYSRVRRIKR